MQYVMNNMKKGWMTGMSTTKKCPTQEKSLGVKA
jgi:hypothetical protein